MENVNRIGRGGPAGGLESEAGTAAHDCTVLNAPALLKSVRANLLRSRRYFAAELRAEPGASNAPVPLHSSDRDVKHLGHLRDRQPYEEPQRHHEPLPLVHSHQAIQCLMQRHDIQPSILKKLQNLVQGHAMPAAIAFDRARRRAWSTSTCRIACAAAAKR